MTLRLRRVDAVVGMRFREIVDEILFDGVVETFETVAFVFPDVDLRVERVDAFERMTSVHQNLSHDDAHGKCVGFFATFQRQFGFERHEQLRGHVGLRAFDCRESETNSYG